ncbi:MAG: transposase [Sulfurovum sp.]|nr:transposase [Sulfurovum sp.]
MPTIEVPVVASELFKGFNGYLQTDGYAGYNATVQTNDMTHLACWAHARRKVCRYSQIRSQ